MISFAKKHIKTAGRLFEVVLGGGGASQNQWGCNQSPRSGLRATGPLRQDLPQLCPAALRNCAYSKTFVLVFQCRLAGEGKGHIFMNGDTVSTA